MIEIKAKGTGAESPNMPPVCNCYCFPESQVMGLVWGFAQGPGCYCWCPELMAEGGGYTAYWRE